MTNENGTVQAIVARGLAAEGIQEVVLSAEEAAARRLAQLVSPETIDRIVADTKEAGIALDGREGLFGPGRHSLLRDDPLPQSHHNPESRAPKLDPCQPAKTTLRLALRPGR